MRLAFLIFEARHLLERGAPKGDKEKLQYPSDCKARVLRRAADRDPLHLVPGGEHDRVVMNGNTLTTIPHGEPTVGVCQNVIKVLNDPEKAAKMPRFRGQAVKEEEDHPFHTGDHLEVIRKGGDWWSEMKKGALLTITAVNGPTVNVKEKYDIMGSSKGWEMKVESGMKSQPGSFKLTSTRSGAGRYLMVKRV